jgi:hypothetical protein
MGIDRKGRETKGRDRRNGSERIRIWRSAEQSRAE